MALNTKDNPGCYHAMIHYLAGLNGVDSYVTDRYENIRDLYHNPDAPKSKRKGLKYKSYDILVIDYNSHTYPFVNKDGQRFDKWKEPITAAYFLCTRLRRIEEFEIKPTYLGKSYNDSLPGGWYQKVELWQINDKFFANMDCTC